MKKLISAALAALTISAALNGCMGKTESLSPVRALSSSAEKSAEWLTDRLGSDTPDRDILLGVADDADAFGADMSGLRSEGSSARLRTDSTGECVITQTTAKARAVST